jgi:FkbM family methyltransferase
LPGKSPKHICVPKGRSYIRERIRTARFAEFQALTTILTTAARGGSFVEVGANVGSDTALASGIFASGYAFEPYSRNIRMLRKTLELSGIQNVTVFPYAASDHQGTQWLHIGPPSSPDSASLKANLPNMTAGEEVQVVTLDSAVPRAITDVTYLHVDVEGEDIKVLLGAREFIRRQKKKPWIKMEFQPYSLSLHGSGIGQLIDLIDEFDYGVRFLANDHIVPLTAVMLINMFYAWRATRGWIDIYLTP